MAKIQESPRITVSVKCDCGNDVSLTVLKPSEEKAMKDVSIVPCAWCQGKIKTPRYFITRKPDEKEPEPEPTA